jgi:hypothetical protein
VFIPVDVWFRAFVLTVVVETPIAALVLRRAEPSWPRLLVLILFANLATHPAVWFIFTQPLLLGTWSYMAVVEGWAVAAEALFYWAAFRGLPARRAIGVSLLANAASFLVGQAIGDRWPGLFR